MSAGPTASGFSTFTALKRTITALKRTIHHVRRRASSREPVEATPRERSGGQWKLLGGLKLPLGPWRSPWYSDLQLGFVQNDTGDRAVCPGEWRPAAQGPESRCKVHNIRGGTCQTEPVYSLNVHCRLCGFPY